jgi:hypothetical protein
MVLDVARLDGSPLPRGQGGSRRSSAPPLIGTRRGLASPWVNPRSPRNRFPVFTHESNPKARPDHGPITVGLGVAGCYERDFNMVI